MIKTTAHFIWIGEEFKLPPVYQKCIQSFYTYHRNWKVNIWRWKDLQPLVRESKYDFEKFTSFINRYNFLKYHLLAKYGGWYVDFDIQWKRSLDDLVRDKIRDKAHPQLFIPVRSYPREQAIVYRRNDDMLLYSEPNLFWEVLDLAYSREDIDVSKKYEPIGPVTLSKWVSTCSYTREYMFEWEIQKDGIYCNHLNSLSWKVF